MLPPLHRLSHLFTDETACIQFLMEQHVFYELSACPSCDGPVLLSGKTSFFEFAVDSPVLSEKTYRCRRKGCQKKVSLLRNSFFAKHKLSCGKILQIGYLWLAGCGH